MKMEWQPIETAPKDGTYILAFENFEVAGPLMCVMGWTDTGEHIEHDSITEGWTKEGSGYLGECNPTHWMPLPEPPGNPVNG